MERSSSVDALKIVLFLSVVLGHINTPFYNYIYAFHIPAFFFLSGFLMKRETLSRTKTDFVRLIIPFLLFSVLGIIIELLKRVALGRELPDFVSMLYDIYIEFESTVPYYGFVLWFLPIIFLAKFITRVLLFCIENIFILAFLSAVVVFFYTDYQSFLPSLLGIDKLLVSVPFLVFGFAYKEMNLKVHGFTFFFSGAFVVFCALYISLPYFDIGSSKVEYKGASIFFPAFLVVSFLSVLNMLEERHLLPSRLLSLCGSFSMLFFVFHPYTNNVAHILVNVAGGNYWFLKFILSVVFLSVLCMAKKIRSNSVIFKYV